MRKILLTVGILCIIACVLFVLFALIYMHSYYNLFDGTAEHYKNLHNRMAISFIGAIILAAIGTALVIIRSKI